MNLIPEFVPLLRTKRLLLRSMDEYDAHALFKIYGNPEVMRYTNDDPFPDIATVTIMLDSVQHLFRNHQSLEWGIADLNTNSLIGTCGLHSFSFQDESAEVGCILSQEFWGQGLMREALLRLIEYAETELQLKLLKADIDAPNTRSIRLFKSLGFIHQQGPIYNKSLITGDA